jgi:ABC-type antimicrobial peptide transport system permease subunit
MPADPVFMATLEQIGDVSQLASLVQTVVFVCITVLGAVVFFAIQALRAETKRSDLGLLKSLGLSSRQLGLLFLIEGGVLWLGSQVASLVVLPVGYYLSLLMVQSNDELALSFPWLYPLLLSAALSLGVCLGACWLGTSQVRKLSPVMLFPAN